MSAERPRYRGQACIGGRVAGLRTCAIAAERLRRVELAVGCGNEFRGAAAGRRFGRRDADADNRYATAIADRMRNRERRDGRANAFGRFDGAYELRIGKDDEELFAAVPREAIAGTLEGCARSFAARRGASSPA